MSGKYALIIGNSEYIDPGLAQLSAPSKDAEDFARVLKDKEIGAFDNVKVIVNEPSASVIEAIDEFFDQKKPDDMLVLYFSGHGIKDEIGSLYLAFKNTIRSRLRSTAIKSDYIKEAMDQSRSKRQVLILDCCNSGAFPQGTKAELGGAMGMTQAFQGYGRFVLTASDATQFAWEGDKVIGETDNSLFTHFLVKGLEGEADNDGDGRITVDELYDYAFDQISKVTPKQTPTKSSSKVEGEIVLRQSTRYEDIKSVPLSDDLINEIEDTRPYVREVAVQKLDKIIKGRNIGLARSAREAIEKIIADENTTRRVAQAATQILESIQQAEQIAKQEEADKQKLNDEEDAKRIALQKAEAQRILNERAIEAEFQEKEKAELFVAQKTEEERLAKAKAEAESLAQEKQRVEKKVEAERKAKVQAEKPALQKVEKERTAKANKVEAGQFAEEKSSTKVKVTSGKSNTTKPPWLTMGTIGVAFVVLMIAGIGLSAIMRGENNIPISNPSTEVTEQTTEIPQVEEVGGFQIPAVVKGKFNVAMVLIGPHDDGGWSQAHYEGLLYVEKNVPDVHVAYIENVPEGADSEQVFRALARKGFDLILGTSFGFGDPMEIVAGEFPDSMFIHITGIKSNFTNFGNLMGAMEDMKYLAGMLAGARAKADGNPKLGYMATFPIPEEIRLGNAIALGMKKTCPECTMDVRWINTWHDPVIEKEAAASLFDAGAQVVFTGADTPAVADVAQEKGKWGVTYDWYGSCKVERCLTAPYWVWGPIYAGIAEKVIAGTYKPGYDYFDAETGALGLFGFMEGQTPQPGVADLDPAVVQEVRDILAQMQAGTFTRFDVFTGPINDNKGNVVLPAGQSLEQVDLDAFPEYGLPCTVDVCMKWWAEGITAELPQ